MTSTDLVSSISQLLQLEMETRQHAVNLAELPQNDPEWSMPRKVNIIPRGAEWGSTPRKVNIGAQEASSPHPAAAWKMSSIRSRASSNISGSSTCDTSETRSDPGTPTDASFLGDFALSGLPAPGAHLSLASAIPAPPPGLSVPIAAAG